MADTTSSGRPRGSASAPTLTGAFNYPPPSVPPISNAPYMQSSRLPDNFVFIVVGAALGFIVLVVFTWRLMSSWAMNRNSKNFATSASGPSYAPISDSKKNPAAQSGHDMADLSQLPRSFSSVPSLFFSPTAEAARQTQRPVSHHLPAGHYRDGSDPARR